MRLLTGAVLAGLLTGSATAADPKPTPKTTPSIISLNPNGPPAPEPTAGLLKVSPGKLQVLRAEGVAGPITWNVLQPVGPEGKRLAVVEFSPLPKGAPIFGQLDGDSRSRQHKFDADTLVLVATGDGVGFVTVQGLAVEAGAVKILAETVVEVLPGKKCPEPSPGPGPQPPPDPPAPIGNVKWALVLEESAARTPAISKVLGDLNYWRGLEAKGVQWRFYDKDSPDAKKNNYTQMVADTGLPALLLLDETGKKLKVVKLPDSTAGVDKEIGK